MQTLQAGATASTSITGLAPAGADDVSAQAATVFAAEAAQMLALSAAAQEELMRTGAALADIARMYAETDAAAAGRLLEIRPPVSYRLAG
jgi:PE family